MCTPLGSEFKVNTSAESSNWASGPHNVWEQGTVSYSEGPGKESRCWAAADSPHHRPT